MILALTAGLNFEQMLDFVFGSSASDILFLKVGLWLIIFAVLFKSLEKIVSMGSGKAAVLAAIISAISMRFMPEEWMAGMGTFIWIIVFIAVPYFFISALTQPGFWRWLSVIVTYLALFYSLAGFQVIGDKFGLTGYLKPVFDFLAPVLYLISDTIRLNSQQIAYILAAIVLLFIILAIAKSRPKSNEFKMPKPQYVSMPGERKPSLLSKIISGVGEGAKGAASRAAERWKQERERSRRDAERAKEQTKRRMAEEKEEERRMAVAEKEQKKSMEIAKREQQKAMELARKEKEELVRREQKMLAIKQRMELERQEKIQKQIAINKKKAEEAERKAMEVAKKEEMARYRCRFCGGRKENPNDQMCRACFKKGLEEQLRKQPKMLPPHRE